MWGRSQLCGESGVRTAHSSCFLARLLRAPSSHGLTDQHLSLLPSRSAPSTTASPWGLPPSSLLRPVHRHCPPSAAPSPFSPFSATPRQRDAAPQHTPPWWLASLGRSTAWNLMGSSPPPPNEPRPLSPPQDRVVTAGVCVSRETGPLSAKPALVPGAAPPAAVGSSRKPRPSLERLPQLCSGFLQPLLCFVSSIKLPLTFPSSAQSTSLMIPPWSPHGWAAPLTTCLFLSAS